MAVESGSLGNGTLKAAQNIFVKEPLHQPTYTPGNPSVPHLGKCRSQNNKGRYSDNDNNNGSGATTSTDAGQNQLNSEQSGDIGSRTKSENDSDNNNVSRATTSDTIGRHRMDSVKSGDSGYDSRRVSRNDSDRSTTGIKSEYRAKCPICNEKDRNGNNIDEGISNGSENLIYTIDATVHGSDAEADNRSSMIKRGSTIRIQQIDGTMNELSSCSLCLGSGIPACDMADISTDRNTNTMNERLNNKETNDKNVRETNEQSMDDIAKTLALSSSKTQHVTRHDKTLKSEYLNRSLCIESSDLSKADLSGPINGLHRKSNSFSHEVKDKSESLVYRAKTRKRYKSEGNGESGPLLPIVEQQQGPTKVRSNCRSDSADVRIVIEESELASYDVNLKSSFKCEKEGSREHSSDITRLKQSVHKGFSLNNVDYVDDLSGSSGNTGTFGSVPEHAEQASHSDRSSLTSVILRDTVKTECTVSAKQLTVPDETLRDSLTVNYDKNDLSQTAEESKTSSVAIPDEVSDNPATACKSSRAVCCDSCSGQYVELVTRIDKLTNDYQWQNKITDKALSSMRQLKVHLTRLNVIGVLVVTVVITLGLALVVVKSFIGCDLLHEVANRNITSNVAGLSERYSGVSDMVNDLMTKSTSILRLTNRYGYSEQDNRYHVAWRTHDHEGQGDLRLSDTGDSVIVTAGGYYVIYVKLQYTTTLVSLTSVRLEYDVVQVAAGGARSVQHTTRQFTAARGPLRQEIPTQTTLYAYPGDTIQISLRPDQLPLLANFSKAHELSMFELK